MQYNYAIIQYYVIIQYCSILCHITMPLFNIMLLFNLFQHAPHVLKNPGPFPTGQNAAKYHLRGHLRTPYPASSGSSLWMPMPCSTPPKLAFLWKAWAPKEMHMPMLGAESTRTMCDKTYKNQADQAARCMPLPAKRRK